MSILEGRIRLRATSLHIPWRAVFYWVKVMLVGILAGMVLFVLVSLALSIWKFEIFSF